MDIYTQPGEKVKFLNKNGYDGDREQVATILNMDEQYTVRRIDIGSSMSYVYLKGFDRSFNTVMFENVGEYRTTNQDLYEQIKSGEISLEAFESRIWYMTKYGI